MCAEVLALTTARLLAAPSLVADAKAELHRRSPVAPARRFSLPPDALFSSPERFWNGTWDVP